MQHASKNLKFDGLESLQAHKDETEDLLFDAFPDVERIVTWDFRVSMQPDLEDSNNTISAS